MIGDEYIDEDYTHVSIYKDDDDADSNDFHIDFSEFVRS